MVLVDGGLAVVRLRKQRWLEVATGATQHDRPAWDVPRSPYGLDVAFLLLCTWLSGPDGLHSFSSPWPDERPARRTLQRWLRRLAPRASQWLQAIRLALLSNVAPRPLEDLLPAGGIPPPERGRHQQPLSAEAWALRDGGWLTKVAPEQGITGRSLLVEARRRWPQ